MSTRSLWIAEGITNYYGHLMLRRSGMWDDSELLRSFGRTIRVVVNDLVDESSRVLGFRPTLHFTGVLDTIDETVTAEAAAVAREALSNVARHSRARKVDVTLSHRDGSLTLLVIDDGEGIPSSHRLGSGLLNMHDRAERLGGACNVISDARSGTTVRWTIPVGS